jgi:NAD(P)H-dependent flavin oxidoreductase YrpB (nitropropane dioxygenase family)
MKFKSLAKIPSGILGSKIPIIQGGMGVGISLAGLAGAVANQGGIGVISTAAIGMDEPDFFRNFLEANIRALRKEIRKAREITQGVLGVNIMVAMANFVDMVKVAIEEAVDVIFAGAGLPVDLPGLLAGNRKTKLVPIVSSGKAARIISRIWLDRHGYLPDAVVVEGPMAGVTSGSSGSRSPIPATRWTGSCRRSCGSCSRSRRRRAEPSRSCRPAASIRAGTS